MEFCELPLRLMRVYASHPTPEGAEFLESRCILTYLRRIYRAPEDFADALDGAFAGYHIIRHAGDEEGCVGEIIGWYRNEDETDFKSPFYDGLSLTLCMFGLSYLLHKAIRQIKADEPFGRME